MRLPRHWARVREELRLPDGSVGHATVAYGSSDTSHDEAVRDARARARRVLEWLDAGQRDPEPDRYGYASERPLREELVREIAIDGERVGAVTRNAYGSLILNTEHVMFIDVDEAPSPGFIGRLLGRSPPDSLGRLRAALRSTPGVAARIYRTAKGWRALVTSQLVEPAAPETDDLLERAGSDPRFRALCRVQRCFRARLTPKPWRCGMANPPDRFPYADASAEARLRAWVTAYDRACADRAVCEYVETTGVVAVDPTAAVLLREHDAACLRPGLPLA